MLILALVGAGSKAGLVPLHVWLPLAHPAAPSHVSALMSGVMTKVAVYGFVRIVFDLLGEPAWWWSMVVLALGGITAVMGVLYALMQHDLKRLLAYHTVENIGIIFIGLGLALAFKAYGMPVAAALALTAGLLHVFNHSLFKSLLFFGAGAVLTATGERDMEHLGGLIHRMPQTAFVFLVGCAAISALPPLNGFVSEWLTFQAILLSPQLPSWGLKFLVPAVGALLALSAALAAACFVKAFGITFLGRAAHAGGRARAGDRPAVARRDVLLRRALPGRRHPARLLHRRAGAGGAGAWSAARMPVAARRRLALDRADRREPQLLQRPAGVPVHGDLGHARRLRDPPARLRPAAARRRPGTAAIPIRARRPSTPRRASRSRSAACSARVVFRAREHVEMPPPGDARPARLTVELRDLVWDALYAPIAGGVGFAADRLNHLQFLTIRQLPQPGVRRAGAAAAGARDMAVILDLAVQGAQMLLVLLLAPLLTGFVRKVKARLLRRRGPPLLQPYRDLVRLMRKEVVLARERLLAVPRHPLPDLRRHLGGGVAGADLPHRPAVLAGRPT